MAEVALLNVFRIGFPTSLINMKVMNKTTLSEEAYQTNYVIIVDTRLPTVKQYA